MNNQRILIISAYSLFVEAIVHVLQDEGIDVAATAVNLETALPLIQQHRPNTIIIDGQENCWPGSHIISLLNGSPEDCQVIFLTLSNNQMIVHQRRVSDATPAGLVWLLRQPAGPAFPAEPGLFKISTKGG